MQQTPEEEEKKRLENLLQAMRERGFSAEANGYMERLIRRYEQPMAFNPAQPFGTVVPGPYVSASAYGSAIPEDSLEKRIGLLRGAEWNQMCAHWELTRVQLTFERDTLYPAKLHFRVVRQSDDQGVMGTVEMTSKLEEDWELLLIHLNDALEALAMLPEQPGWAPGMIPR